MTEGFYAASEGLFDMTQVESGLSDSSTPENSVKRNYKDKMFRYLFNDRQKILELYNTYHGTNYENPEDIEICTIENVIYLGLKNDISFLFDWRLSLWEHQSTWCENMPLRGFLYFARKYSELTARMNLYSTRQIRLPYPEYIVFYNGTADQPDRVMKRLSEAFDIPEGYVDEPALECCVTMLNINHGKNTELMKKCKPLREYALFIHYVRTYQGNGMSIEAAVDEAVRRCLSEGVLTELFTVHRKEVVELFLDEYNYEKQRQDLITESEEIGFSKGESYGFSRGEQKNSRKYNSLIDKLFGDNRIDDVRRIAQDDGYREQLFAEYGIA